MPVEMTCYGCSYCNQTFDTLRKALLHERFSHLCGKCVNAYSAMCELHCKYNFNCGSKNQKFKPIESQ